MIQRRTSPGKFAVLSVLASPVLGSFLPLLPSPCILREVREFARRLSDYGDAALVGNRGESDEFAWVGGDGRVRADPPRRIAASVRWPLNAEQGCRARPVRRPRLVLVRRARVRERTLHRREGDGSPAD